MREEGCEKWDEAHWLSEARRDIAWAAHLASLSGLRSLSLGYGLLLTPEAASALAVGLTGLQHLGLECAQELQPGCILPFTQLTSLDLSGTIWLGQVWETDEASNTPVLVTRFSPAPVRACLPALAQLPALARVKLHHCQLVAAELQQLAGISGPGGRGRLVVDLGYHMGCAMSQNWCIKAEEKAALEQALQQLCTAQHVLRV
jgi:hypothetical protein